MYWAMVEYAIRHAVLVAVGTRPALAEGPGGGRSGGEGGGGPHLCVTCGSWNCASGLCVKCLRISAL
eukprot:11438918-Alexandrium_andersonii.AAC.1